ncbi:MAG: T9SS type A sorting domain-containing protein [Hymenobacteraceae bacterium]|nr:T9SS type A sorting domain-containing protein [Hymenobacteraceae bacterium]
MKNFTKLFFIAALISSHMLAYAADAREGVVPTYKGGATVWKLMPEKQQSQLIVSAQNARPAFVAKEDNHTCSKIYAAAVSKVFHLVETKVDKSTYAAITLASFAPGRELKQLPSISAYPNPSRGLTRFMLSQSEHDSYKIRISNTIGKVVKSAELPASGATNVYEFDMSSLPAGIYFYSLLVNDKTVETKRLVLQK